MQINNYNFVKTFICQKGIQQNYLDQPAAYVQNQVYEPAVTSDIRFQRCRACIFCRIEYDAFFHAQHLQSPLWQKIKHLNNTKWF